jgi:hypothetical protein
VKRGQAAHHSDEEPNAWVYADSAAISEYKRLLALPDSTQDAVDLQHRSIHTQGVACEVPHRQGGPVLLLQETALGEEYALGAFRPHVSSCNAGQ